MFRRPTPVLRSMRGVSLTAMLAVTHALVLTPTSGHGQLVIAAGLNYDSTVELDPAGAGSMFDRAPADVGADVLLQRAGRVRQAIGRTTEVVVHVFRMRGAEVVERASSRPFLMSAGQQVRLGEVLPREAAGWRTIRVRQRDVFPASRAIPAATGSDDPGRFVTNGVFFDRALDWGRRNALYIIAVPSRPQEGAQARPLLLLGAP